MSMFPELDAMMNRAQKGDLDAIQSLQQEARKTLDLDPDVSGGVMPDGSRVGSAVDPNFASTRAEALEPSDEPRFGDRLRARMAACAEGGDVPSDETLADAIDQDAHEMALGGSLRVAEIERAHLRRQIEEAVRELQYPVDQPHMRETPENGPWPRKEVLDVEPFLERLGQIFSASSGEAADDELCCSTCGRPYVIHGINCPTLSRNSK